MSATTKKRSPLSIYWKAAMPEWGKMSLAVFLACVAAFLEIVPYILIWLIAEEALSLSPDTQNIWWFTAAIFGAIILRFSAQAGVTILGHLAGFRAECRLRIQLIEHLQTIRPIAVEGKSGQLSRAIMDEVGRLNGVLAHTIPDLISGIFLSLSCAAILFWIDWRLALAALFMLLVGLWAQSRMAAASPQLFEQWMRAEGRAASALLFYVRGLATLRAFNRQADSLQEVKDSVFAVGKLGGEVTRICAMPYSVFTLAMSTPLILVLPCAFWFYSKGTLSISNLIFFISISGVFLLPLCKVVMNLASLRTLQAGAAQLQQMIDLPSFNTDINIKNIPNTSTIIFENVSYSVKTASGEEACILQNVSFSLAQGSITTVTGPSGSGKTTLARLLARLDDVSKGRILIGGYDIRSIPHEQFQRIISVVFQDPFLFHGTLRENLRLAKPNATEEELLQAVEAAGCTDMLKEFPLGLDTPIGDKGLGLSGGEQQRIAIARAFLKDAPILILDEATAHLDPIAAKEVSQSLNRLMTGKTVFAISHRLRDIENADTTLVLVGGELESMGTHDELLVNSPSYQKLWALQEQSQVWRLGKDHS